MSLFSKEQFNNFIEYLYLVSATHYYIDNYGNIRSKSERVIVRFLPYDNYYGILRKNKEDLNVIVIDENSNLESILSKIDDAAYTVKRSDLNYENYTTRDTLDELYPNTKNIKKGLGLFRRAS